MPTKIKRSGDANDYIRIPVTFNALDKPLALAVKQAVEKREERSRSWAYVVRLAFRALAKAEGVKCK